MRTVQMEFLRPQEIVAERERCSIVYLPVGPLEWHGPAMPYGTDPLMAQEVARAAAQRTGGVVMPTLFFGTERERPADILAAKGFEHPEDMYVLGMDVPKNCMKSFYAREELFALMVREHLRLLVQQGYKLIVIVNGHGAWGQRSSLERLAVECGCRISGRTASLRPTTATARWSRQPPCAISRASMSICQRCRSAAWDSSTPITALQTILSLPATARRTTAWSMIRATQRMRWANNMSRQRLRICAPTY